MSTDKKNRHLGRRRNSSGKKISEFVTENCDNGQVDYGLKIEEPDQALQRQLYLDKQGSQEFSFGRNSRRTSHKKSARQFSFPNLHRSSAGSKFLKNLNGTSIDQFGGRETPRKFDKGEDLQIKICKNMTTRATGGTDSTNQSNFFNSGRKNSHGYDMGLFNSMGKTDSSFYHPWPSYGGHNDLDENFGHMNLTSMNRNGLGNQMSLNDSDQEFL
jgi:hypothetical protein